MVSLRVFELVAAALAAQPVLALIRFPCSQLVTERFDPSALVLSTVTSYQLTSLLTSLVTPGVVSPHLHQIVGGVCCFVSRKF
jgi:hypothetical protein